MSEAIELQIGASGVSGWNRVSVQRRLRRASACAKDIFGATRSSLAKNRSRATLWPADGIDFA